MQGDAKCTNNDRTMAGNENTSWSTRSKPVTKLLQVVRLYASRQVGS